jgi:putative modified peptide
MARPYEIKASISREKARELIELLATDDDFRARFQENPRSILFEYRIDVSHQTLPETVTLPEKKAIQQLLSLAESIVPESASPFGLLALFVVFGAMPVRTGGRPAADGTG